MFRAIWLFVVAAVLLLWPARLIAGGPPWLCLPVDGVTADNVKECTDLLTDKLKGKFAPNRARYNNVELHNHANQWYLTFYMGEDVGLREVEAALKGSRFSVPRDRLRLFGHVILEIDAGKATDKQLLAALEALNYVSVAKSEHKDDLLLVTVDMPYPVEDNRRENLTAGWDKFERNDFASDQATKSEPAATPRTLPSYEAFRGIVAKHKASLKDIRWSTHYACRPLGGVAVASDSVASASAGTR
jgi:hypothetical protein